jgi:hypothetical protein
MKRQNSCESRLGKLVHQLLRVINFLYSLRFRVHDSSLQMYRRGDSFWGLNHTLGHH